MLSVRTYVPSRALLRALSRPRPASCPFARPLPALSVRNKSTKAAKALKAAKVSQAAMAAKEERVLKAKEEKALQAATAAKDEQSPNLLGKPTAEQLELWEAELADTSRKAECEPEPDYMFQGMSDEELERDDFPTFEYHEDDMFEGKPRRRLISKIITAQDRKDTRDMGAMILESYNNPDYDDAHLNRRLVDSLIANPNFADLTQELLNIKEDIRTKKEEEAYDIAATKEAEAQIAEFHASFKSGLNQWLQDLLSDPDIGDAASGLQEIVDSMSEMADIEDPEFQDRLQKAVGTLNKNEAFQKKMAAEAHQGLDKEVEKDNGEWDKFEKDMDALFEETETEPEPAESDFEPGSPEDMQDFDQLLVQMRDILKVFDGENAIQDELNAVLNNELPEPHVLDVNREVDFEELAEMLTEFAKSHSANLDVVEDEDVPADLKAKVDKIMADPKLLEKLTYIQKLISENGPAFIAHDSAPDPYKLDKTRLTTLKEQMDIVQKDPEHLAALRRLRVKLMPPFSIAPALKSFNQAIELAYLGANDDIRRILWRSYQKARTLPTFLSNLSDEAWDIMYYSQAVTWGSNQNRLHHLHVLLVDLKSLGRDGPPTHPRMLVKRGDGEHLES